MRFLYFVQGFAGYEPFRFRFIRVRLAVTTGSVLVILDPIALG